MPKVYVPQEPRVRDGNTWRPLYDLSPAIRFGSIEVLLSHGPMLLDTAPMMDGLKDSLKGYTESDFIMCIGDPVAIAAAVLVASQINHGKVTLLKFSRSEKQYNAVTLQF